MYQGEENRALRPAIHALRSQGVLPGIGEALRSVMPAEYERVVGNPRVVQVHADGPRYVARCNERFDAILDALKQSKVKYIYLLSEQKVVE